MLVLVCYFKYYVKLKSIPPTPLTASIALQFAKGAKFTGCLSPLGEEGWEIDFYLISC